MPLVTPHLRRRLGGGLIALIGFWLGSTPVAAHGTAHTAERGIDLPVGVAIVSVLGVSAGLLAVLGRDRLHTSTGSPRSARLVGILLMGIGAAAGGSVFLQQPSTAVAGGAVGIGTGVIVAARGSCGLCAEVTVGAIAVHRLAEGVTIAALSAAGTAVSLFGVIVLASHTVIESVAIGLQPDLGRVQALGAILTVTAVFVLGTGLGIVGLGAAETIPTQWIAAIAGGLLVIFGLSETQPTLLDRQPSTVE